MNKAFWTIFVLLCLLVGLYPLTMVISSTEFPTLISKSVSTFQKEVYFLSFYVHVIFGGIALLIGWVGFIEKFREGNMQLHRLIGKMYIISVFLSGATAIYVATKAYGGLVSSLGFTGLALAWLFTTYQAYRYARNVQIQMHQRMMHYSYAVTFAAVTFRIWNPLLAFVLEDELTAYQLSSWLCWIVNLSATYFLIDKISRLLVYEEGIKTVLKKLLFLH
jgi:uncharacterized membrane protein